MSINEQKIQCPQCGTSISIDDVLTHQIEEKIKKDFEVKDKIKEQEFFKKSEELKKQAIALDENKKNIEIVIAEKLSDQLKTEKLKLFKEAKAMAEKEQNAVTELLEEQLKDKDNKLAQATQNEIALRKEKIKLEEDKQVFELEKMRQLEEAKKSITEEATKKAAEEQKKQIELQNEAAKKASESED